MTPCSVSTSAGHWVSVRFPDGRVRFDWVPADQPPAPAGQSGRWHVVRGGARQPTRWEWHAAPEAPAPPLAPVPVVGVRPGPDQAQTRSRLPAVRPPATFEVLPDRVYRTKRSMGVWFWLAAVILAAIGGAGAVAMTTDQHAQAGLAADARKAKGATPDPAGDAKPSKAELVTVAHGYLTALLAGNVDELLSYLDPSCQGADPGFALAARWAKRFADGATVSVRDVEIHGRRGSVTDFALAGVSGDTEDALRRLLTDENADGEQSFPWHFTGGEWYFKGDCGSTESAITAAASPDDSGGADGGVG